MSVLQFINCPTNKNIDEQFHDQLVELGIRPRDPQDAKELMVILNSYLGYPDDLLANNHRKANRLGLLDLTPQERAKLVQEEDDVSPVIKENVMETRIIKTRTDTCRCCGYFVQEEDISNCSSDLQNVIHLGTATRVFFKTFSFLALLFIVMILIYSIFAFVTNVVTAKEADYLNANNSFDYLSISLGAKSRYTTGQNSLGQKYYYASAWLGVAMLGVWCFLFARVKRQISAIENRLRRYLGVSDFSIVIENMPVGFESAELEKQLNAFLKDKKEEDFEGEIAVQSIKVVKYNEGKPFAFNEQEFSDDQLVKIHKECEELRETMASYVLEYRQHGYFKTPKENRSYTYAQFKQSQQRKLEKYRDITTKLRSRISGKHEVTRTVVFVTFLTHEQRNFVLEYNKNGLFYKFKRFIHFWKKSDYFSVVDRDNIIYDDIKIERPPEPQDVNWGNLGLTNTQKFFRICFTVLATIVMVGISFVVVYALSTVQRDNQSKRFISVLISLAISAINLLIIKVIQVMTVVEKVYSMNNYQISIAIKSVIAQSLNSIFVPIMVNYYIKDQNIFGVSGLAEDIFILGLASSFVGPVIKLVDPWNLLLSLRYKWYHDQERRLYLNQYELNQISQKMQFEIGLEYIYLIHNFIFVCFFVSLQPILPLFALIATALMYWLEKYSLLSRCQRPVPGPDSITSAFYQLLFFGPVAFALGNLTWSWFLPDQSFRNALLPNLIAFGLSLVMFMFPYDLVIEKEVRPQQKDYYQRRIYFTAEYDRLNPSTNRQAIEEYRNFLVEKQNELHGGKNQEMEEELMNGFLNLSLNNTYKPNYLNNLGLSQEEIAIQQILYNESRNMVNPLDLLNNLVPRQQKLQYSFEPPRNKNPFNQLFGKKGGSAGNVVVGPSMHHMYQEERSNKYLDEGARERQMSIEQNLFNDEFKNVYHSNIRLDHILGLTSKIIPDAPHHPAPPKSGDDFGGYPSI